MRLASRARKKALSNVTLPKRETVAKKKVIKGFSKDVYKEFKRQGKSLIQWLNRKGVLNRLEAYSRRHYPDLYDKNYTASIVEVTKAITDAQRAIVDKYIKGWDKSVKPENMEKVFAKWHLVAADMGGQQALNDLGISLAFHLKDPAMLEALAERGVKITGLINEKTLNDFRNILVNSYMEEGISPYEVKRRIKGLFTKTYKNRAMTIARTETGTAQVYTQHATYKNNGIKFKMWLALIDQRTRASHEYVNGQVVKIDEPFDVDGVSMQHPFDGSAPSQEIVNCRCDEEAIIEGWSVPEDPWKGEAIE